MVAPSVKQARITTEPTLKDLLDIHKKDILLSLNCHALATIQSANFNDKTVTATVNYSKTYFEKDPTTGEQVPKLQDYPILVDVPFLIIGGGGAGVTFPIKQGDECLILFNDRDIDNWFAGATSGPVATARFHSFSDGLALVGFNFDVSIDPNFATLFNGETGVAVSTDLVKIYNATTTLNTLLQQILTQLETLANTVSVPGNPLNPAVATALVSLATDLGGLLG